MLEKILQFSLSQRPLIILLLVILGFGGIFSWTQLRLEAYPDVADTEVAIITKFNGRSAEEVELQVTIPVERALNSVPNVIAKRSRSIFGLSVIRLTFTEDTNDYFARQRVLEPMQQIDLPSGAEITLGPLSTPVGEILRYVIEADKSYSVMQVREIQDWVIIPKIKQAQGIADINNFGGLVKQYKVIINPSQLDRYHLTAKDISDAVIMNNESTGGNVIPSGASQLVIRSIGRISNPSDIENIVVTHSEGVPVFIRDIASVEQNYLPPAGILGYKDNISGKEAENSVEGIVLMRRGENPGEVIKGIKEKIAELNDFNLPHGMKIRIIYDRDDLVNNTLSTVGRTLIEGISIVLIVLIFFLGNMRAAFAVALTIPLSLLFAFVLMKITGIPANLLSLGAIDFGIIVDASVVMVEAISRKLVTATREEKKKGIVRLIHVATGSVQRQVIYAVSIIILAFLPLFTLQRVEGKLFSPMAYTLSYAIFGSLLLSITAVPVISSYLFSQGFTEWHNPVLHYIEEKYKNLLSRIIEDTKVIKIAVGLVVFSLIVGAFLGTEFLPELDEGSFNIRCVLPAGISIEEAKHFSPKIRKVTSKYKEVKFTFTQLGRNDDGTDPYGPNRIETMVLLNPYSEWKSGRKKKDLLIAIRNDLKKEMPGARFSFSQPILDNVSEAVTGSAADLAILINGQDLNVLRNYANQVLKIIKTVPGASESSIEQEGPQTQLIIEVDRQSAARYGINVQDISNIIELAIAGKTVSQVYEGERRFDISLRYTKEDRNSPNAIGNLLVLTHSGLKIPLSQVAKIYTQDGQTVIARQDSKRQISVKTNIRGRDQGSFVAEAQKLIDEQIKLPEHYSIAWGGQYENLTRAKKRLFIVIPLIIVLIFIVLFSLFDKNIKYALVVMSNVPFALIGGIFALAFRGINFSVSAGVGFVSLFGVSIMSGVLLISYINYLRVEKLYPLKTAVMEGAKIQFRPVMMMMSVALIGLIPAAMASGIGSDIQRPLASVIVGGLLSSLILTLLVMPVLYYTIEKKSNHT